MAKKKRTTRASTWETRASFVFPSLHDKIVEAASDSLLSLWFKQNGNDNDSNRRYSTYVNGTFSCASRTCRTAGWSSGKVTILIRRFGENGYDAEVFNQRCRTCNCLGKLTLDEQSYVDRVVYRLKRWAGIATDRPPYTQKASPPHRSALCEGCRRGVCGQVNS